MEHRLSPLFQWYLVSHLVYLLLLLLLLVSFYSIRVLYLEPSRAMAV